MESEVDRLSGMVDSLLKLTNLEQVPRSDRIKLGELLHQAAEDVSPLAAKKGIAILVEASLARSPAAEAAPPGTVQSGGKCGQIRAGWRTDTALCGVEWSRYCHHRGQSGTLYPPELRERIFEPSFGRIAAPGELGGCRPGAGPGPGHCRNPRRQRMGGGKSGWLESIFWSGFRQYVHEGEPSFPAMLL